MGSSRCIIAPEMEILLIVGLLVLGLGVFVRGGGLVPFAVAAAIVVAVVGAVWLRVSAPPPAGSSRDPASTERPLETRGDGFVSSDACRSCHPSEYASWKQSYHRTMTQIVTPETMLADWDGNELEVRGRTYRLEQVGDQYWVDMVDLGFRPDRRFDGRPVARPVESQRTRRARRPVDWIAPPTDLLVRQWQWS